MKLDRAKSLSALFACSFVFGACGGGDGNNDAGVVFVFPDATSGGGGGGNADASMMSMGMDAEEEPLCDGSPCEQGGVVFAVTVMDEEMMPIAGVAVNVGDGAMSVGMGMTDMMGQATIEVPVPPEDEMTGQRAPLFWVIAPGMDRFGSVTPVVFGDADPSMMGMPQEVTLVLTNTMTFPFYGFIPRDPALAQLRIFINGASGGESLGAEGIDFEMLPVPPLVTVTSTNVWEPGLEIPTPPPSEEMAPGWYILNAPRVR